MSVVLPIEESAQDGANPVTLRSVPARGNARHVLKFEQPLAELEEQIERLSIQKDEAVKNAEYEEAAKLRDQAHEVVVVERNRPDDTFGWGVVLSDETLENLARFCLANGHLLNIEIKPTPGTERETGEVVAAHAEGEVVEVQVELHGRLDRLEDDGVPLAALEAQPGGVGRQLVHARHHRGCRRGARSTCCAWS